MSWEMSLGNVFQSTETPNLDGPGYFDSVKSWSDEKRAYYYRLRDG